MISLLLGAFIGAAHAVHPVPAFATRGDIVGILQQENKTRGVELGVQFGAYAAENLSRWSKCERYALVDSWGRSSTSNYNDLANVEPEEHERRFRAAIAAVKTYSEKVIVCRDTTVECAKKFGDFSFDWVYVDARHSRKAVLEDMRIWWPKLARNGLMCGHDYVDCEFAARHGQDWCLEQDGTRDETGGAVKGAVNEFAQKMKRQVQVGTHDGDWPSWCIRK